MNYAELQFYYGQVSVLARLEIAQGALADISTLLVGEMAFATDTYDVLIGSATGNVVISSGGLPGKMDFACSFLTMGG